MGTKVMQLWNVGGGLPLDAFKKGAIVEWSAGYELDEGEISPLLNALEGNTSLTQLGLGKTGPRGGTRIPRAHRLLLQWRQIRPR